MAEHGMKNISRQLRQRRKEVGLTQRELAQAVGVDVRSVERYEAGGSAPPAPTFLLILSALGMEVTQLEDTPRAVNVELAELRLAIAEMRERIDLL